MRVYRVEKDKTGPFTKSPLLCMRLQRDYGTHSHPGMRSDWPVGYETFSMNRYVCAVPDKSLLSYWFGHAKQDLTVRGYTVVEYEAEEVVMGKSGKQCFFKLSQARSVASYSCTTIE